MPVKWDGAKPAEKLLSLYSLLMMSRRDLSLTELSGHLNCSKQAVLRLIGQLEGSRYAKVIAGKRGREAIYRFERPNGFPRVVLNPDGLRELAMCRNFLLHLLPPGMRKSVDSTLRQAAALVPEGTDPGLYEHLGRPAFKGRIDYGPFGEMLETIVKAIEGRRICAVSYRPSLKAEPKEFRFAPRQLTVLREAIYVEGWMVCGKGQARFDDPATLAVHRLLSVGPPGRDGAHLPDLPDKGGSFRLMRGRPFRARVRFSPGAATYVAEREWGGDERKTVQDDGSLTLSFVAQSQEEVISWILSFGGEAEAMSPKWLREAVEGRLSEALSRYGRPAGDDSWDLP
ncbi:MAG: WYL domain-containing protein [Deltaproteobacteria bacterium]|jgi:predicted DNA-binding transcriptional regulator YafY|nr:WYL domain-containing protein [Deltaproteobacteria bacterium]